MIAPLRYLSAWRTLPGGERNARTERVLDRWLRRDPSRRALTAALGLPADPPRWRAVRAALSGHAHGADLDEMPARLRRPDRRRGPLYVGELDDRAAEIAARFPAFARGIADAAPALIEGRFDLLGSGPFDARRTGAEGGGFDWHRDPVSALRWDDRAYFLDLRTVRGDGSDVKLPWELSRMQHLLVLGQAYRLAPHLVPSAFAPEQAAALRARCAAAFVAQVDDFVAANPCGVGVNWTCTMDVGLRALTWCAGLGLFRGAAQLDDGFLRRIVRALWVHGRFIRRQLEIGADGLTSNHYLSDIVGLAAIAALLPELRASAEWGELAFGALAVEAERQLLPDGVDFERSLPYHRLVVELFLHGALLAEGAGSPPGDAFRQRLAGALAFTAAATRPDGSIPQWGDNDDGRALPLWGYAIHDPLDHRHLSGLGARWLGRGDRLAPACEDAAEAEVEALWCCGPRPSDARDRSAPAPPGTAHALLRARLDLDLVESAAFPDAKVYVLRAGDLHVFVPCGGVGTRGLGNHTHNDFLSTIVWAAGREWITDPGTGTYTRDPRVRNRLRATAAHATLQLGAREQNAFTDDLDGLFSLREHAHPECLRWSADPRGGQLTACHVGYSDGRAAWRHERTVALDLHARTLVVRDVLSGRRTDGRHAPPEACEPAFLRFPLAPGVVPAAVDDTGVELTDRDGRACRLNLALPEGSRVTVAAAAYSPRYGVIEPAQAIVATLAPSPDIETLATFLFGSSA